MERKQKRALEKGYRLFVESYVTNLQTATFKGRFFVKGRHYRSMRKSRQSYYFAACIGKNSILDTDCNCPGGRRHTGCVHCVSLLYTVAHLVLKGANSVPSGTSTVSCTDLPQQWSVPRGPAINPAPVMSLTVKKPRLNGSDTGLACTLYNTTGSKITQNDCARGVDCIKTGLAMFKHLPIFQLATQSKPGYRDTAFGLVPVGSALTYQLDASLDSGLTIYTNIVPMMSNTTPIKGYNLQLPVSPGSRGFALSGLTEHQHEFLTQNLLLSLEEARSLEERTRLQTLSTEWHDARRRRVTASKFGLVINRKSAVSEAFINAFTNPATFQSHATNHGQKFECVAVSEYTQYMKRVGHACFVSNCGLVVNPSWPWLGASPDRKVVTRDSRGLVEVKCPYSKRDQDLLEACTDTGFFLHANDQNQPRLKTTSNHYMQVQGQMAVAGLTWCDFVVYTNKSMLVERIQFDADLWHQMVDKLTAFYFGHLLSRYSQD